MAELIKKAYFKNTAGATQTAKLYTTLNEVQGQGVSVITMSDNMIPVEKRKFEGWVAYQGAVVTVIQDIPMPEWGTTEATSVQISGGSSSTKLLYSAGIGNSTTLYRKSVYAKNTGTTSFSVHGNNITSTPLVIKPGESVNAIIEGFGANNTLSNSLEFTSGKGVGIDMIVYQPVIKQAIQAYMNYGEVGDANATSARIKRSDGATKAILAQAQVPYGSQLYTTTGVFTIPAGISKLRVTAKGAGGGGGGALWVIDDSDERYYLINNGGNGGRGGLSVQTLTVTPGVQYPVTVGSGGSGGSNDRNSPAGSGAGGGASSFLTVSATGGGGGGGGSYGSSGSSGTNGSPAGAGANGGSGSSGVGNGNGGIGANGSVLIEWGGDIK